MKHVWRLLCIGMCLFLLKLALGWEKGSYVFFALVWSKWFWED